MSGELETMYRELILDHASNPRHFGPLGSATHTADAINPLCGDKLHLYLEISPANRIENASFEGSGCAISMASASLLTETVTGLPVATAEACFESVTARLRHGKSITSPGISLDKLEALDGVREFPSRVKCATLAWHALHAALGNLSTPATTE
jgi:nitrogen fixation NifU-like protein